MMAISTRGRYATRIMVLLASQADRGPMTKYEIGEAEGISPAYVQQLLMALRLGGLARSHRGRDGGFSLPRPAGSISVLDVLQAVEGELMPAPCAKTGYCDRSETCPTRPLWQSAASLLTDLFQNTTIEDLMGGGTAGTADLDM
jgi:Rrf2 family iron-sulfur cluster assembly transcriptional regulator